MKILITGANGQLGNSIRSIEHEFPELKILYTDVEELNILDRIAVNEYIKKEQPAILINCADFTAVDLAETEQEKARLLNTEAPGLLADAMNSINGRMFHVSTDYVFDGKKSSPYSEDEKTSPTSVYGKTKQEGEKKILKFSDNLVIRTAWLYSEYGKNFFKTMYNLLGEKDEIRVVADQTGTPTYGADLARALLDMARIHKNDSLAAGIYHYSNEGRTTWHGFAEAIGRLMGSECKVTAISTAEYPVPARRPEYSLLSKEKIKKLGILVPDWEKSLEICFRNYQSKFI